MTGSAIYFRRDDLVAELGEPCTNALLGAFGGERLYVPAAPGREHVLVEALGAENAAKVAAFVSTGIGGMWIELPCASRSTRDRLRSDPVNDRSEREIARELRVSPRTVRRARAAIRAERAI